MAPALTYAETTLQAATSAIARMPISDWSSINSARAEMLQQLPGLSKTVAAAGLAAKLVPSLLGAGLGGGNGLGGGSHGCGLRRT